MRGLTREERAALAEAIPRLTDSRVECSPAEEVIYERLVATGRAVFVDVDDDWGEWVATDDGRLALRVCPPEES